jgi:hypothetical protein
MQGVLQAMGIHFCHKCRHAFQSEGGPSEDGQQCPKCKTPILKPGCFKGCLSLLGLALLMSVVLIGCLGDMERLAITLDRGERNGSAWIRGRTDGASRARGKLPMQSEDELRERAGKVRRSMELTTSFSQLQQDEFVRAYIEGYRVGYDNPVLMPALDEKTRERSQRRHK